MASMGLRRNERRTAFLSHCWTVHSPFSFSAIRTSPQSRAAIAASTAERTSPRVSGPMASRSSQERSTIFFDPSYIIVPQDRFEPFPDVACAIVDRPLVVVVIAALGAVVD